jgi:hypothetical protein
MEMLQPLRLIGRSLPAFLGPRKHHPEDRRERWRGLVHEEGEQHLREESTSVLGRPERSSERRRIANCLRSQDRLDSSKVDLFSRISNPGPFIAALRPFPKIFFSDKFAQHCGHTSRMGGIASNKQTIHYIGGRCIAIFCSDNVDHGISQSLVIGNGLPQKRFKNSDSLPKLRPLALQGASCLIERLEFFFSALKRPLVCGFHFSFSDNLQYRRVQ